MLKKSLLLSGLTNAAAIPSNGSGAALIVEAHKPQWETGARAAISLRPRQQPAAQQAQQQPAAPSKAWVVSADDDGEEDEILDEEELLTEEDKQRPAPGGLPCSILSFVSFNDDERCWAGGFLQQLGLPAHLPSPSRYPGFLLQPPAAPPCTSHAAPPAIAQCCRPSRLGRVQLKAAQTCLSVVKEWGALAAVAANGLPLSVAARWGLLGMRALLFNPN